MKIIKRITDIVRSWLARLEDEEDRQFWRAILDEQELVVPAEAERLFRREP